MKFLGIDYGKKRIGVAVSDESGALAFPKCILVNDRNALGKLLEIVKAEKISGAVIGESLDSKGRPNRIDSEIRLFVARLQKKISLPIYFEKEFLTSVEARRYSTEENKRVDASAAALILQRHLDRKNNTKLPEEW